MRPRRAHWDANVNRRVWVKAETTVRGRRRVLVALVQVQEHVEFLPKKVILAGQFELTPNGNGVLHQDRTRTRRASTR